MTEDNTINNLSNAFTVIIPALVAYVVYVQSREDLINVTKEIKQHVEEKVVKPITETIKSPKRDPQTLQISDESYYPNVYFYITARSFMLAFMSSLSTLVYLPQDIKNAISGAPYLNSYMPTRESLFRVYTMTATDTALNYIIPDNYTKFKESVADIEYENYRLLRGSTILGFSFGLSYTPVPEIAQSALIAFLGLGANLITTSTAWISDGIYVTQAWVEYKAWLYYQTESDVIGFTSLRNAPVRDYINAYMGLQEGVMDRTKFIEAYDRIRHSFSFGNAMQKTAVQNQVASIRMGGLRELIKVVKERALENTYNNFERIVSNLGSATASLFYSVINYMSYLRASPDLTAKKHTATIAVGSVVTFSLYMTSAKVYTAIGGMLNILNGIRHNMTLSQTEDNIINKNVTQLKAIRNLTEDILKNVEERKGEQITPETMNKEFQRQGIKTLAPSGKTRMELIEDKKNITKKADVLLNITNQMADKYGNKTYNSTIEEIKKQEVTNINESEVIRVIELEKVNISLSSNKIIDSTTIQRKPDTRKTIPKTDPEEHINFVFDTEKRKTYITGALGTMLSYHSIRYTKIGGVSQTFIIYISDLKESVIKTLKLIKWFFDNNIEFWTLQKIAADGIIDGILHNSDSTSLEYWKFISEHYKNLGHNINI